MKLFKLSPRKWRIVVYAALTAVAAFVAIFYVTVAHAPAEVARQNARLARGSMLTLKTTYSMCGHELSQQEALVCEGRDVNRAELQALYPKWQLTEFSADGAQLVRALDFPCEKHYLVRLTDSRLTISRSRGTEMVEVGSASIARDALDPELIAQLEHGRLADTLAQAEGIVEDVES